MAWWHLTLLQVLFKMWDAGSTGRDGSSTEQLQWEDTSVLLVNRRRAEWDRQSSAGPSVCVSCSYKKSKVYWRHGSRSNHSALLCDLSKKQLASSSQWSLVQWFPNYMACDPLNLWPIVTGCTCLWFVNRSARVGFIWIIFTWGEKLKLCSNWQEKEIILCLNAFSFLFS